MPGNGDEETSPDTWPTCLHCPNWLLQQPCRGLLALQEDKVRQSYLMLQRSSVENDWITAEHIPPGPKNVKLNLLSSWWLREQLNSQLEPFYETVCFEGQGSPCFHMISLTLLWPKHTPWTNLPTLPSTEKMCVTGKNWNNFYELRKQFNVEVITFYIIKYTLYCTN